jgi:transcriptional regulator with XRE-family HTH domain
VRNDGYSTAYGLFRDLLKQLRESNHLTQAELARRLKVPQSYASKFETGERRLDFVEAAEVCRALGTSVEEFAVLFESHRKGIRRSESPKAPRRRKA